MAAADQPRFLFWLVTAFIMAFVFYNVAMLLLPRLVIFNQLPDTGDLYVDSSDALAARIAYSVCNLWTSKSSFAGTGFDSTSQYKPTSGSVGMNEIGKKLEGTKCSGISFGKELKYSGDAIQADKRTYDVKIMLNKEATLIEINVKRV